MTFGEKLRIWIEKNFSNIQEFCEKNNYNYATIHHYLSNRREPNLEFLKRLEELGCDINWLLSDDDKPPPDPIYINRIKQLEEENRLLRDSIAQLYLLTQELEKRRKKPKKR